VLGQHERTDDLGVEGRADGVAGEISDGVPRARDEAVQTTWSSVPRRSPSAMIEASSVTSTNSVSMPSHPA
jgi:hypothetical protein